MLHPREPERVEEVVDAPPAVSVRIRTARPSPAVPAAVVLVAAFFALAIVKPWGGSAGPRSEPAASARTTASGAPAVRSAPTPVVDRETAIAEECHAPSGWRVVTSEQWQGREVRIWWAITPVASRSAFEPGIPYLSIISDAIHQLGYCAPLAEPDRPSSTEAVGIWRIDPIAQTAEAIWHETVPGPLGIVGGEDGVAQLAGLEATDQPSIFTTLDRRLAPWITDQRLRDQGMLLVWPQGWRLSQQQQAWIAGLPVKTVPFDWSLKAPPLEISFAVIPPGRASFPGDPPGPPDPE